MSMRDQLLERVGKPHLSYSSLKYALGDMRLWEMYMRGQLKKESEALSFGSLYDLLLFEPEKFNDVYFVLDDTAIVDIIGGKFPRNTKRYREWKAEQVEENPNKELASTEDVKKAKEMIQRLKTAVCTTRDLLVASIRSSSTWILTVFLSRVSLTACKMDLL